MLARKHSVDAATRFAGGYVGVIRRKMLDQGTAAKVFNAYSGDLIGPFNRGSVFQLILVEEIKKAELDDDVSKEIKERLFDDWFSQMMKGSFEMSE